MLAWLALAVAGLFLSDVTELWQVCGALLAAAVLVDWLWGWQRGCPITIERVMPHSWPVGVSQNIELTVRCDEGGARLRGEIFDDATDDLLITGMPRRFAVNRSRAVRISYRALAQSRGPHQLGAAHIRLEGPLGLVSFARRLEIASGDAAFRVFPDFARIANYTLMATDNRLAQIGLFNRRRRGEGMEFQQLREYRQGDSLRQIDWKATARQHKLIAREYQEERNQQIVFLLDCGQRMRTREAVAAQGAAIALSHFDHTVNALLLLAYVALRQGDGVGMATFAHPSPRLVAPRRSQATLNRLMNSLYDIEPSNLTPDYLEAGRSLGDAVRKRSLIIVLTNLRDEDDDSLQPAIRLLNRRHLVVVASLREPGLAQLREKPVGHFEDALAYASATEYLYRRQRSIARLRKSGVQCLDVAPAELPMALVNQYWAMKRSGVL